MPGQSNILNELELGDAIKLAKKKVREDCQEDAAQICKQILERFPHNRKVKDLLKKLKKPVPEMQADTDEAYMHFNVACKYHAENELEKAIENYELSISIVPNVAEVHFNLGNAQRDNGEFEGAINSYKRAVKLKPKLLQAYDFIEGAFFEKNLFREALSCFKEIFEIGPEYKYCLLKIGNAQFKIGNTEEAIKSYRKLLREDGDNADAFYNLGVAFAKINQLRSAILSYQKAVDINPEYYQAFFGLGNTLRDSSRLKEALISYKKALEIKPDYVEIYRGMGATYEYNGEFEKAIECFKKSASGNSDFSHENLNIGSIIQKKGNPDLALQHYIKGTKKNTDLGGEKSNQKIVALHFSARAGALFFHSLLDGHPEISTLPGVYFKGWFGNNTWDSLAPDPNDEFWRDKLANTIIEKHKPLFDATNKNNVVGKPFGNSSWLAKASGFMDLGDNRDLPFSLDHSLFKENLIRLLKTHDRVDKVNCFKLIHEAFDLSFRELRFGKESKRSVILYHIHNPSPDEMLGFLNSYTNKSSLFVVRHPIQNVESWMLGAQDSREFNLESWQIMIIRLSQFISSFSSPFARNSWGIRLEDIKTSPKVVMPKIANWLGIEDHPSLYKSEFCGLQYWGPKSDATGAITGFDTSSIERPLGRVFGDNDLKIIETLFWPFAQEFNYTQMSEQEFKGQLDAIESCITEPLEFEETFYQKLNDTTVPLRELPPYRYLHSVLESAWNSLTRDGTYKGMVKPLFLED